MMLSRAESLELASEWVKRAIVCDMTLPWASLPGDFQRRDQLFGRLRACGYNFISVTCATDEDDAESAFATVEQVRSLVSKQADKTLLVAHPGDIDRGASESRLAISLHFQGTMPFTKNLDSVERFYQLGIRHALLAYNQANLVADGCHESRNCGLTDFGRRLIAEMNRVGMLVDVAHTGYRSSLEAIDLSASPVIVSHGNVAALNEHPRCYRDDQLRALASRGGVIGITGIGIFLGDNQATPRSYARHVDHVVQLVGPMHVGIGMDYVFDLPALAAFVQTQTQRWPQSGGYQNPALQQLEPEQLVSVVSEFIALGYREDDVRLILGGNWVRIANAVWK
jgi:membrane dipeptidase